MTMLSGHDDQGLRDKFHWNLPDRLNMAEQCLAHDGIRMAIIGYDGVPHPVTYAGLSEMTDTLAHTLAAKLQAHAKRFSAARTCPREIAFLKALPMTVTGKVMHRELRTLAISEPISDTTSDERAKQ